MLIINPIKDSICEFMFQNMTTIKIIHYHISQLLDSWLVDWLHVTVIDISMTDRNPEPGESYSLFDMYLFFLFH